MLYKVLLLSCQRLTACVLIQIQTPLPPLFEQMWIRRLMRVVSFHSGEQAKWSGYCTMRGKPNGIHVAICGWVSFYPWAQSPINCLFSEEGLKPKTSNPSPHTRYLTSPPARRSNFFTLNNCNGTAIVSSLEAVTFSRTKVIATDW